DGRLLAITGTGGWVRLWDVATKRERLAFRGHERMVNAVAFSPDGQRIASASADQTVRVWDVDDGRLRLGLEGHTGAVQGVAFSPDGRLLPAPPPTGRSASGIPSRGWPSTGYAVTRHSPASHSTPRVGTWPAQAWIIGSASGASRIAGSLAS